MNYILYKLNTNNKILVYKIEKSVNSYVVTWGQIDGKLQSKHVKVTPKNIGKANETTLEEQILFEMEALYTKLIKEKGYCTHIDTHNKSYRVMLAQKYDNKYVKFPCYVQPKLDGVRAGFVNGKLMSRLNTEITTVPHINEILIQNKLDNLDGELFWPGHSFQELISVIKRKDLHSNYKEIEYNIFDVMEDKIFSERSKKFLNLNLSYIKPVSTYKVTSIQEILNYHQYFTNLKYEGTIVRNDSVYEYKRSYNLLKLKDFLDEEFKIVGTVPDENGECVFNCITQEGKIFGVKTVGTHEERVAQLSENYVDKLLTVKYIRKTDDNIPFHAVGLTIRDYE